MISRARGSNQSDAVHVNYGTRRFKARSSSFDSDSCFVSVSVTLTAVSPVNIMPAMLHYASPIVMWGIKGPLEAQTLALTIRHAVCGSVLCCVQLAVSDCDKLL